MPHHAVIRRASLYRACYVTVVAMVTLAIASFVMTADRPAEARVGPGVHPIIVPGLNYTGNASCAGAKCHTADKATEQSGQLIGDENNIWDAGDPHSHAFVSIEMDYVSKRRGVKTADMAKKLSIADTTKSDKCLTCHAVNAPTTQRGETFRLQVGVGCEGCHGPAQKYREPHAEAGWTQKERKELGTKYLLDKWGLVDTSNLAARANTCVACHLQIDKALVDAGHPPLRYDQYTYNTIIYKFFGYYDDNPDNDTKPDFTHWSDPAGIPFAARLWATGIAASHESAKANLKSWNAQAGDGSAAANLFDWYTEALAVAKKHFGADTAEGLASANVTEAQAKAAAADLVAMAATAKTPAARWGIAQGIAALGDIFNNGDQPFWDGYNEAGDAAAAGGDAYLAAIKKMAEKVK